MADYYGFDLIRDETIKELSSRARLFRHRQTGAELLSLENDDDNKLFGITFCTPPTDSTGVSHILEHSVLCGSRKYPLKEPFVELIKGSLKTFLNAFTFPDKTCYPAASQNTNDFYNLIDVYLDAVFYPRLTPAVFQQEGWHYELPSPDGPLTLRGVVYSEMKGAYSAPERLLGEYGRQSLFPDTPYGFSSGGDPRHIPDLTYEQLRQFHQTYYHPSNARIFFYGDDDPERRLKIIHEYLKDFQKIPVEATIPLQQPFAEPVRAVYPYPIDPDTPTEKKTIMTVNWLLDPMEDMLVRMSLQMVGYILVGMLASPLRKALIESGLGEDLVGGGMASGLRQAYFSTGLKGIARDDAETVERLIFDTLETIVREGLDRRTVEAVLNTTEFLLRENNTGNHPRGLVVMLRSLNTWLYGGDPLSPLAWTEALETIKSRIEAGEPYFEQIIERSLLHNPHRTTIILEPDPDMEQRESSTERERLEQIRAAMKPDEVQSTIETVRLLKQMQETPDPPEALATIPRLKLEDLDRYNRVVPLTEMEREQTRVLHHALNTNGILYLDIGLNLHGLPQELLPFVAIFARALREMGTEKETYVQLAQRIGMKTGGIRSHPVGMITHAGKSTIWLFLRAKATMSRAQDLLDVLSDILQTANFDDRERFEQIVLEAKAREETSVLTGGSGFVNLRMRACFNEADWVNEQMGGITYLFFLRQLIEDIRNDWPGVRARLEQVRSLLLNRGGMICNVTLDGDDWADFAPRLDDFLTRFPNTPLRLATWTPQYGSGGEGLTAPTRVNYVGKAVNLFAHGYTFHGSIGVITNYLRTTLLWERVRMRGGAYGSFCRFGRHSGILSLVSYRDPNLLATLDVYDQLGQLLREAIPDADEVTRNIIGRISDLDAYLFPDARGYRSLLRHLAGHTDEIRQQKREEILSTTAADFRAFADMLDHVRHDGLTVVLGSPEAIETANAERAGLLSPLKVL